MMNAHSPINPFGNRYRLKATLIAKTDLHIGCVTDLERTRNGLVYKVADIIRGEDNTPVIPATTIKGCIRKECESFYPERTDVVFGKSAQHNNHLDKGGPGQVWFYDATANETFQPNLPLMLRPEIEVSNNVFESAHVSLDIQTGAADDNKLFHLNKVAAGTEFEFQFDWLDLQDLDGLRAVLSILNRGLYMGQGTSKGNGLVTLKDSPQITKSCAKSGKCVFEQVDGEIERSILKPLEIENALSVRKITLKLHCQDAFISMRGLEDEGKRKIIQPLIREGRPLLWPESLVGAMRTRALWLAEVDRAKTQDVAQHNNAFSRPNNITLDDRTLKSALGDEKTSVDHKDDLNALSSVELLFGVTGLKSSLNIKSLECTQSGDQTVLTSTSIDRFTGGGRDGFLYNKRVYSDVIFTAAIALAPPGVVAQNSATSSRVETLFDQLIEDLTCQGLELGHGASRGFGWFTVEIIEDSMAEKDQKEAAA